MKKSVISKLLTELEKLVQTEFESGVEFWFARDLQGVLGYTKWDNFRKVVEGAIVACETSGHKASDHFPEVGKMIPIGKGGERSSVDCGSLLPLSAKQPAASGSALARRSRPKPQSYAVDSRLSHGKLQQAVAVQSLRQSTMPDQFPGLRKLIQQFTFSTTHYSLATSHS
jgi:hypothetical protein